MSLTNNGTHEHDLAAATTTHRRRTVAMAPKFIIMIVGAIVISFGMVLVSMELYNRNGAAQLDFSRPSYQAIRAKAQQTERYTGFNEYGEVNAQSLEEFDKLYKAKSAEIKKNQNNFDPKMITDKSLDISVQ